MYQQQQITLTKYAKLDGRFGEKNFLCYLDIYYSANPARHISKIFSPLSAVKQSEASRNCLSQKSAAKIDNQKIIPMSVTLMSQNTMEACHKLHLRSIVKKEFTTNELKRGIVTLRN